MNREDPIIGSSRFIISFFFLPNHLAAFLFFLLEGIRLGVDGVLTPTKNTLK